MRQTRRSTLLDCDVETPNAALFLDPAIDRRREAGVPVPVVDAAHCSACGRCAEVCAYHAIAIVAQQVLVFREICHGCGSCAIHCPENAITERLHTTGRLEAGAADGLSFAHGRLNVGEAMAPPVIRQLKSWMLPLAGPSARVILDAPPGTACPLVQTVQQADYALLVTEPTPFGLHDLRLAVEVVRDVLRIPVGIVLNRERAGASDALERFCEEERLPILLRIPFERRIAEAYSRGIPLSNWFCPVSFSSISLLLPSLDPLRMVTVGSSITSDITNFPSTFSNLPFDLH